MTENCRADRARKEAHRIDRECLEHADQRLGCGKEQFAEHQSSNDAVEEKIVPFKVVPTVLAIMARRNWLRWAELGQRARQNVGHCHGKPP